MSVEDKPSDEVIAILFVDVVDSSRLYATYGDSEARRIVGSCLKNLSQVVTEHSGEVVKSLGDELMCAFASGSDAVLSAVTMHQRLGELISAGSLHTSLNLRIGIHEGAVVRENNDIFGDAVNLAARMAAFSKAHQIMVTKDVVDELDGALRPLARFVDKTTVKGQSGVFDLYEIVWNTSEATMVASGVGVPENNRVQQILDVSYGEQTWTVSADNPVLTFGRSSQCNVVIQNTKASRLHAKIEYGKGGFILRDVSTNGTFFQLEDGRSQHVRRDETDIQSNGLISLGDEVDPESGRCVKVMLREEKQHL